MKIERNCLFCSNKFKTSKAEVNRGYGKFCSRSCSSKYGNSLREHNGIEVECTNCKKSIRRKKGLLGKVKNFFCSRKCKSLHEGIDRNKNCLNCNKKLMFNRKSRQRKYCSQECQNEHNRNKFITEWKEGICDGGVGESISTHIRKYLFDKYDHKCCKCGWAEKNPITNLIPLTVNHINGNPYDHREENLELICPNCHSLTPNYGGLNLGNGRRERS